MDDKERRIREAAYNVWEEEGRPEGQAHQHWAKAAHQIEAEILKNAQPAPESDESAEQSPLTTRTVRGKSGLSRTAPVADAKSPERTTSRSDRRPLKNR
jgi:hypothetical protein